MGVLKVSVVGRGPLTKKLYSRRASKAVVANGRELVGAMRTGPGSVQRQFRLQTTLGRNFTSKRWPKVRTYPKSKFQARGLKRTGRYMAAWLGQGSGSFERTTPRTVEIGVDSTQFPQVQVFQKDTPTGIPIRKKSQRYAIAFATGVWLKKATQLIIVEPRAFRVNPAMILSMRRVIVDYIINGRSSVRTAGGRR
jgi:hypothetical protein